jgi:hypothetical protein
VLASRFQHQMNELPTFYFDVFGFVSFVLNI